MSEPELTTSDSEALSRTSEIDHSNIQQLINKGSFRHSNTGVPGCQRLAHPHRVVITVLRSFELYCEISGLHLDLRCLLIGVNIRQTEVEAGAPQDARH